MGESIQLQNALNPGALQAGLAPGAPEQGRSHAGFAFPNLRR
jgi:hypothetical protein